MDSHLLYQDTTTVQHLISQFYKGDMQKLRGVCTKERTLIRMKTRTCYTINIPKCGQYWETKGIKELQKGLLSIEDVRFNQGHASARIIVENFFGRMGQLWHIVSRTYNWDEDLYDSIFCLCVALTNFNISLQPLRAADGNRHTRYINTLIEMAETRKRKRSDSQSNYRVNRKHRLSIGFTTTILGSDEEEDE